MAGLSRLSLRWTSCSDKEPVSLSLSLSLSHSSRDGTDRRMDMERDPKQHLLARMRAPDLIKQLDCLTASLVRGESENTVVSRYARVSLSISMRTFHVVLHLA